MVLNGIVRFVIAGIVFLLMKNTSEEKEALPKVKFSFILILIGFGALISGTSSMLQLIGASHLPATINYPFITGGTIVFTSIAGVLFFKEKLKVKTVISIALCFIGTLMFL